MNLVDRLHCPRCKGRLASASADALRCAGCDRTIAIVDGMADFAGEEAPPIEPPRRHDDPGWTDVTDLLACVRKAAGDRWPATLGDIIELGCGDGRTASRLATSNVFRSMLLLDAAIGRLRVCREHISTLGLGPDRPILYATLSGSQDAIRDAVADTVVGMTSLPEVRGVRGLLAMVHRVMKPNGRALFVVPNRRFRQAACQALAEALVQRYARDAAWPEGREEVLRLLAQSRRLVVYRNHIGSAPDLAENHLFDSEAMEETCREAGFATAEMLPLDPDPAGAETMRRLCQGAGVPDGTARSIAGLAEVVGEPFFGLLSRQDSSPSMLLWLTKGSGPAVRVFTGRSEPAPAGYAGPEAALGGASPRWSVEMLGRDTANGIVVAVGGWCLANTNVLWVRLTLDGVARNAPVWHPRSDVHEVMNGNRLYRPLNALCSGLESELLFDGVHPTVDGCTFCLEIVLASGLVVTGPAPDRLMMDASVVVAH